MEHYASSCGSSCLNVCWKGNRDKEQVINPTRLREKYLDGSGLLKLYLFEEKVGCLGKSRYIIVSSGLIG